MNHFKLSVLHRAVGFLIVVEAWGVKRYGGPYRELQHAKNWAERLLNEEAAVQYR